MVNYFFHLIHSFHRISYNNLPQKSMRWIFVRNAVNFCKKCGELRWNIYFHRIPYKNLPKNLDPGGVGKRMEVSCLVAIGNWRGENKPEIIQAWNILK